MHRASFPLSSNAKSRVNEMRRDKCSNFATIDEMKRDVSFDIAKSNVKNLNFA